MYDISALLVGGVPLAAVIFGVVEFIKKVSGLRGKWLTMVSLLLGLAFGAAYQFAVSGLPTGFGGWFAVIVFSLMLGLVASGYYKFLDSRLPKG